VPGMPVPVNDVGLFAGHALDGAARRLAYRDG
jgi:hypothetical protein